MTSNEKAAYERIGALLQREEARYLLLEEAARWLHSPELDEEGEA